MPQFDKPLEELVIYDPPLTKEPDFDEYWDHTLAQAAQAPLNAEVQVIDFPALNCTVHQVFYDGWEGARICAWYIVPDGDGPFPALVQYHGYSGYKGEPDALLGWALQGYAVMAVDVRGQSGESIDSAVYPGGHVTGWMTQGIMDPERYFYRGVYVDCVRALDFCASRDEVDADHIGVMGGSQGGALTLAVAALDDRPAVALPEEPYLCHFGRAVRLAMRNPYLEISNYIKRYPHREEQVWRTLSYVDNLNLADRISCPVLTSVGLVDDICPPSTVFAAYNKIQAPKDIKVYPFHNHERVDAHQVFRLRWAHHYLKGLDTL